jgi:hypothetical protein
VGPGPENTAAEPAPFETGSRPKYVGRNVIGYLIPRLLGQFTIAEAAPTVVEIGTRIEPQPAQYLDQLVLEINRANEKRSGTP